MTPCSNDSIPASAKIVGKVFQEGLEEDEGPVNSGIEHMGHGERSQSPRWGRRCSLLLDIASSRQISPKWFGSMVELRDSIPAMMACAISRIEWPRPLPITRGPSEPLLLRQTVA